MAWLSVVPSGSPLMNFRASRPFSVAEMALASPSRTTASLRLEDSEKFASRLANSSFSVAAMAAMYALSICGSVRAAVSAAGLFTDRTAKSGWSTSTVTVLIPVPAAVPSSRAGRTFAT